MKFARILFRWTEDWIDEFSVWCLQENFLWNLPGFSFDGTDDWIDEFSV